MKLPPSSFPIPRLKGVPRLGQGQATSKTIVTHRDRGGEETTKFEHQGSNAFPAEGPALAGVGFGLTLPGPEKTYLMARVDAFVYLPCEATEAGIKSAMAKASEIVQEQLAAEAKEAQLFFDSYRR